MDISGFLVKRPRYPKTYISHLHHRRPTPVFFRSMRLQTPHPRFWNPGKRPLARHATNVQANWPIRELSRIKLYLDATYITLCIDRILHPSGSTFQNLYYG